MAKLHVYDNIVQQSESHPNKKYEQTYKYWCTEISKLKT